MPRCRSVVPLWLVVIVSAGCDHGPPSATGPDAAFQAERSASNQPIPFKTSSYLFHGVAAVVEPGCDAPGESRRYLTGEGSATHLGSYTVELSFCARSDGILEDGRGTFVAANGDLLHFTFEGTSAFVPPFTLTFTSHAVFTGGTRRFGGASGEAVVTGSLDVRTGAGDGKWEGTISSVGSNVR